MYSSRMNKFLFISTACLIVSLQACSFTPEFYPFSEICDNEIATYCSNEDVALGECMIANEAMLGPDCGSSVFYWAGDRYGWREPEMRERWESMNREERHEYVTRNRGSFDGFHGKK
jgi:hypothetical protein